MRSLLLAGLSACVLSVAPALADQCKVPISDEEMRARVAQAAKMTPARLRELAPNSHMTVAWGEDANSVAITNLAGLTHSVNLSTGSVDKAQAKDMSSSEFEPEPGLNISPSGEKAIAFDGYDFVLVDLKDGTRQKLTNDGTEELAYGFNHDSISWLTTRLSGYQVPPVGLWSPDGRYFAALRVDRRGLREWPVMIAGEPERGVHRLPKVEYLKLALVGDEKISQGELVIFDTQTGAMTEAQMPPVPLSVAALPTGGLRWGPSSEKFYIAHESRDFKTRDAWVIDVKTGKGRVIYTEKGDKPLRFYNFPATVFWPIGDTSELLVYSERDNGRGHFFVYDINTGKVLRQITKGNWSVFPETYDGKGVSTINLKTREVFFTAAGREEGRDPYYFHLYKVSLDGGPVQLLTPEDKNHKIAFSLDHGVFVDEQSTVGGGTKTIVRKLDGTLLAEVAETDLTKLKAIGWKPPQRVRVLAADGKTPMWGTLTQPAKIEGKRCHPILDAIYAGPQSLIAPTEFLQISWMYAQTTAQMGFAVLQLDSRGTPLRDRKFRDATYGLNFGSSVTADDHAAALKQLAKRFDYIDADRAGIYGSSWGAQHAVRAMAFQPDVFKVGVATSGSHSNYGFHYEHDRWLGTPQEFPETYVKSENFQLASRIKGKLLMTHGINDDDTHVMNSYLMANALADANVPFDMLIFADHNHNTILDDPYVILRSLDYFTRHLLDTEIPFSANITDGWEEKPWYEY